MWRFGRLAHVQWRLQAGRQRQLRHDSLRKENVQESGAQCVRTVDLCTHARHCRLVLCFARLSASSLCACTVGIPRTCFVWFMLGLLRGLPPVTSPTSRVTRSCKMKVAMADAPEAARATSLPAPEKLKAVLFDIDGAPFVVACTHARAARCRRLGTRTQLESRLPLSKSRKSQTWALLVLLCARTHAVSTQLRIATDRVLGCPREQAWDRQFNSSI